MSLRPEEGFVQSNGLRLHYLTWHQGSADLPPLLLLHANGFLARLWEPVAQRLAYRYRVYAYDMRGHGDSDKPSPEDPDNYHWRHLVDDLRGFMEAFSLRDAPVVGHSSGGAAAAYLAGTQRGVFAKMVLIEPIIIQPAMRAVEAPRISMAEGARKRRQVWASEREMIDKYRTRATFERWTDEALRLYAEFGTFRREDGQVQLKCAGDIEARMFENSASLDIWEVLPDIAAPALVLKGEHTDAFLSSTVDAVAAEIPGGRSLTVPGAGHLAPMEQPEALAGIVLGFLGDGS